MDQIRAMKVFLRVAERGSLTAASLDLGLSRGGASAIITELEKYLGVQLIERTTRSLRLTEDGQFYLDRARSITEAVTNLENEVGRAERQPRGRLRVQIPAGLAALALAPAVSDFLADYPLVDLEILSRDGVPDFVGDQIDAAVLIGALPAIDIVARPLGRIPLRTVAAPRYLEAQGTPDSAADLAQHCCIPIISSISGRTVPWRFRIDDEETSVPVHGRVAFETAAAAVIAAKCGVGIIQLASYLVFKEVRAGNLVPVLDQIRPGSSEMFLAHPRHRLKPKKLKVFEQFLIELNPRTRAKWGVRQVE
ncbi:transcriptional regulator, LysR family [Hoeflea sp. IMCC20628]|uniref:LysR family transcriptional regulator n=1 Tax=Hoeflea sp. IMCC20628 TaxID=1620421 RepID=UPI00063BE7FE|nr:LysR family transcriptional regulator [Hoeflea sp. IMCC20628]AKI01279.1 transcriptional regulator, LysR family [Hoeflea sp. IMCC20628]